MFFYHKKHQKHSLALVTQFQSDVSVVSGVVVEGLPLLFIFWGGGVYIELLLQSVTAVGAKSRVLLV